VKIARTTCLHPSAQQRQSPIHYVFSALQEALESFDRVEGEVILDFSSVDRVDVGAVRALEQLADAADGRDVKLTLHGVNVDIWLFRVFRIKLFAL